MPMTLSTVATATTMTATSSELNFPKVTTAADFAAEAVAVVAEAVAELEGEYLINIILVAKIGLSVWYHCNQKAVLTIDGFVYIY